MNQNHQTSAADELRPLAGTDAASAPTRSGFTLRGRTWIYGATLAVAGVLAGSGVAYAVVPPTHGEPTRTGLTVQTVPSRQGVV